MGAFLLPPGTTMTHDLEDTVLRFGCEVRVTNDTGGVRYLVRGSDTNTHELREYLNDEGLIALVGHGRVEAP